jgi:ankyrin repeat protein
MTFLPPLHHVIIFQVHHADQTDLLRLLLQLDPSSSRQRLQGTLPIHVAAAYECINDPLSLLLEHDPETARLSDDRGRLPLHVACEHLTDPTKIAELVAAYPESVTQRDPFSGLLPFQLTQSVEICWQLLLASPQVLLA